MHTALNELRTKQKLPTLIRKGKLVLDFIISIYKCPLQKNVRGRCVSGDGGGLFRSFYRRSMFVHEMESHMLQLIRCK